MLQCMKELERRRIQSVIIANSYGTARVLFGFWRSVSEVAQDSN